MILFPARAWSLPKLREKLPSPVIRQMQLPSRQRKSRRRSQSYEALFNAYTAMQQEDLDTAALETTEGICGYTVRFCKGDLQYYQRKDRCKRDRERSFWRNGPVLTAAQMEQLKLERMPQLRREKMHRALTEIPEKTAATVTEEMRIPLTMEVIQNKKDHNSYRGETSDKGNVRWRIPLFLPFGHEKWNKKSKMGE